MSKNTWLVTSVRAVLLLAMASTAGAFLPHLNADVMAQEDCVAAPSTNFLFLPYDTDTGGDWLERMTSAFDHHYPDYTCSQGFDRECQDRDMRIVLWEGEEAQPISDGAGNPLCYRPGSNPVLDTNACGYISGYQGVTGETAIYYDGHDGYDWAIPEANFPIRAAAPGQVTSVQYEGSYGWTVTIDHLNSYSTKYSHLQENKQNPSEGTCVQDGETIGIQGNSGGDYGNHLHFRVLHNGNVTDPFGWCYFCVNPPPDPLQSYNGEISQNLWFGTNPRSIVWVDGNQTMRQPTRPNMGLIWNAFHTEYLGGPGILPATPRIAAPGPLTETYTSEDGMYRFNYPSGWVVVDSVESLFLPYLTNTPAALEADTSFGPDQVGILFFGPSNTPESPLDRIRSNYAEDNSVTVDDVVEFTVNTRPAARARVTSADVEGLFIVIDIADNTLFVLAAATSPGELNQFESTILAITETIQLLGGYRAVSFFNLVPGQSTRDDVFNTLGPPLSTTTFNGLPQENYQSNSQVHPHEVVYRDNKVVFIREIITNQNEKTLTDIRNEFGIAPYSLYSQEYGISFPLLVYPDNGLAAIGNLDTGDLLEIWYFEPTTFEEFRAQWAPVPEYTDEPEIIQ